MHFVKLAFSPVNNLLLQANPAPTGPWTPARTTSSSAAAMGSCAAKARETVIISMLFLKTNKIRRFLILLL